MSSTGAAEEIHDEENDGYDYEDDDFEVGGTAQRHCMWTAHTIFCAISSNLSVFIFSRLNVLISVIPL